MAINWEGAQQAIDGFTLRKNPFKDTPKAQKATDPANTQQAVNNTVSSMGQILKSMDGANQQLRKEQFNDTVDLAKVAGGIRKDIDWNSGAAQVASSRGGGQNNLVGGYRSFNPANEGSDAWASAVFSSNRNDQSARQADERKAANDQAIASTSANAARYGADQARIGQQSMANAQTSAAKYAADAAKYGASEQARAGIFGSLFGSITNAGVGGFRYW